MPAYLLCEYCTKQKYYDMKGTCLLLFFAECVVLGVETVLRVANGKRSHFAIFGRETVDFGMSVLD